MARLPRVSSPPVAATPPQPASPGPLRLGDIYRTHRAFVLIALRKLKVPENDRQDLCHDVFLVVDQKLPDFDPSRPIEPWLFGICRNVASDASDRARYRRTEPEAQAGDGPVANDNPENDALIAEQAASVSDALATIKKAGARDDAVRAASGSGRRRASAPPALHALRVVR